MRRLAPIALLWIVVGCSTDGYVDSPSSRFRYVERLEPGVSPPTYAIHVEDGYGHEVFVPTERWTDPASCAWDAAERLWCNARGIGEHVWGPADVTGEWRELTPAEIAALPRP